MIYIIALRSEIERFIINATRYFFDTLTGVVVIYLIFLAMFYGIQFVAGPSVEGTKLDSIIIGYIMWIFASGAYNGTSYDISDESRTGTLEQIYLSPVGFHKIILMRMMTNYTYMTIFNVAILFLTMLTTRRWLDIPLFHVLFILTISLPAVYGIGYIMGGLSLVYKKVQSFANIIQFALIFLVSLPSYPLNITSFLPFSAGAGTINKLIVHNISIPLWWYGFLALNSLFYLFIGVYIYKLFEKKAMNQNLLGQY